MSFTIEDAQTLAHTWIEDELTDAMALTWGNEFIQRIVSDKLWQEDTEEYADKKGNTAYALPANFYRTVKVEDSNSGLFAGYAINNGYITFTVDGSYTLTYIAYPAALIAISGEGNDVPLPDAFIYPLAEFLIFKYYNIEIDDEDCKMYANEYEARFRTSLKNIYDSMEIDSETESFRVVARW